MTPPHEPRSPVDLLHVAYGGVGGHLSVVNRLNGELAKLGISSAVLGVTAHVDEQIDLSFWSHTDYRPIIRARLRPHRGGQAELRGIMAALRPRVVLAHSHGLVPALWHGAMGSGGRPKFIIRENHSLALRSWRDNTKSLLALPAASAVVFLSDAYRDHYPLSRLVAKLGTVQVVIPNAAATPRDATAGRSPRTQFRIGMATRLVGSKRVDLLLESCAKLKHNGVDVLLSIAGSGPRRDDWEARTRSLGLSEAVTFEGFLRGDSLEAFYRSLDVYVHITEGEGQSSSVLEAATHALPIVASHVSGVATHLSHERTALLVTNDPGSIAAELERLYRDPQLRERLGAQALGWVSEAHGVDAFTSRYLELFARIDPGGPWLDAFRRAESTGLASGQ